MFNWIQQHDIVFLCEIKSNIMFNVPGFRTVLGSHEYGNHGGVALLFRNHIFDNLAMVDKSCDEQIWFKLTTMPDILFGGCYIVPSDSIYFYPHFHANIQSMCLSHSGSCVIFGDLNARCGKGVTSLLQPTSEYSYSPVDNGSNTNGQSLLQLCKDCDLLIANNLTTPKVALPGALTFRKKNTWISELDVVVMSHKITDSITSFFVDQNLNFPSDHAPITFTIEASCKSISMEALHSRAMDLGQHAICLTKPKPVSRKSIPVKQINTEIFMNKLGNIEIPEIIPGSDPNFFASFFSDSLYQCASESKERNHITKERNNIAPMDLTTSLERNHIPNPDSSRWERILECNDPKKLWHAINWKGQYNDKDANDGRPSDKEFQIHLEKLLNPDDSDNVGIHCDVNNLAYVPVLDKPIEINELYHVTEKQIKPNKSCDHEGVSPGLLKFLPFSWMIFLLSLLNLIFTSTYPYNWTLVRLSMLFKKGNMGDVNNYRGISIVNSISKVYDYILNNRLMLWFKPDREQAGAQPKRGCTEQIVTLRLISNYCFKKRKKLYIGFVDFSKAYDRVPRGTLFKILASLGCGAAMLAALITMYCVTRSIIGTVIVAATIGVRQGSPTSCFLFTIFVNVLIREFKAKCPLDGFLEWLHCLMLMDDTVILATSRAAFKRKLKVLEEYCNDYGMVINADKTKFMVIHGEDSDKLPFSIGDVIMQHCITYTYLGAIFTADGSMLSSLREHVKDKKKHLNKLIIFFYKNQDMPFFVKKQVLDAAFIAALLYGCESWLDVSLSEVEKLYISAIKSVLGVRKTTSNTLCLIELGYPPLKSYIKNRQKIFLSKAIEERQCLSDDPLMFSININKHCNTKTWKYIHHVISNEHINSGIESLKQSVHSSTKTKMKTYLTINPSLSVHPAYVYKDTKIQEYLRTVFTRSRLSSHRLKIETGRWARIEPEDRLCMCGQIQTEEHVLLYCVLTDHIRDLSPSNINFPITISAFFDSMETNEDFKLLNAIMRYYE